MADPSLRPTSNFGKPPRARIRPRTETVKPRVRQRPVRKDERAEPSVSIIIPAHNEEPVIERRSGNEEVYHLPENCPICGTAIQVH